MEMENKPFTANSASQWNKKDFSDKVALIDADFFKYIVTSRVYKDLENGYKRDQALVEKHIEDALYDSIFSNFDAKAFVFCFSAPTGKVFRSSIAQEKKYKGSRAKRDDPNDYEGKYKDMIYVAEYVERKYGMLMFADLEADDILSMLQDPHKTFIYSKDKDLMQVTGYHYDMNSRNLTYTTEEEGFFMLIKQILTGDTVDEIPGLFGFGKAALAKFCREHEGLPNESKLIGAIKQYTDKHGLLIGMDMFVEMWSLISMKINRGDYLREKYSKGFALIENLLNGES